MTGPSSSSSAGPHSSQVHDMQARLYREIGISAVAAALHFTKQPEPGRPEPVQHPLPPMLRKDDLAA